jgi:hypothetical protein
MGRQSGNPNLGTIAFNTAFAQNVVFFATALKSSGNSADPTVIRLHICTTEAALLQYMVDGTNWLEFNSATALVANAGLVVVIPIPKNGAFNLRCKDAAGAHVKLCEVDEVWG